MEEHYSAIREARVRISVCKDVLKGVFVCFIVFAVALEKEDENMNSNHSFQ